MTTATATFEDVARIEAMIPIRKLFEGVKRIITSAGRVAKCALTTIMEKAQARFYMEGEIPPSAGVMVQIEPGATNPVEMLRSFHSGATLVSGATADKKPLLSSLVDKASPVEAVRGVVNFIRTTLDI